MANDASSTHPALAGAVPRVLPRRAGAAPLLGALTVLTALIAGAHPGARLRAGPAASGQDPSPVPDDHARRMAEGLELFRREVRVVLLRSCVDCHGGGRRSCS